MGKIGLALAWLKRYGIWFLVGILTVLASILWVSLRAARRRQTALILEQKLAALKSNADAAYAKAKQEYAERDLAEVNGRAEAVRETIDTREAKRRVERDQEDKDLKDATADDLAKQFRDDGF